MGPTIREAEVLNSYVDTLNLDVLGYLSLVKFAIRTVSAPSLTLKPGKPLQVSVYIVLVKDAIVLD
jgi:hypothetical protein